MFVHTDHDVLETCAKTLEFLCTEGTTIYRRCDVARSNIIDQSVNRYREAIDDWRNLIAGNLVLKLVPINSLKRTANAAFILC